MHAFMFGVISHKNMRKLILIVVENQKFHVNMKYDYEILINKLHQGIAILHIVV